MSVMPVPVLMSGPIRPTEESVLEVIATVRAQIPASVIYLCTWTGQMTEKIAKAVDFFVEVNEPTDEFIRTYVTGRTRQFRQETLPEFMSTNIYRMVYGVNKLCQFVGNRIHDSTIVVRMRTDCIMEFEPDYFNRLYSRCAKYNSYILRDGDGADWFAIARYGVFKKTWLFSSVDDYNREIEKAWNAEKFITNRPPVPVEFYSKLKVRELILRPDGSRQYYA